MTEDCYQQTYVFMKLLRDTHFWKQINVKIIMELQIAHI
jgi:hypothetical protein